jgi:hypothetical protein
MVLLLAVMGCGGSEGGNNGTGGTAGTGGSGTATGGTVPTGDGLVGTWEYIVSSDGCDHAGVIEIASNRFSISLDDTEEFSYWDDSGIAAALYTYDDGEYPENTAITVDRTPAAFDMRALAVTAGGTSRFSDGSSVVELNLPQGQLVVRTYDERGTLEAEYRAVRQAAAESSFGDLGGTWVVNDVSSPTETCTLSFGVNTFVGDCFALPGIEGSATLNFAGNAASGTIEPSGEIAAFRQ